MKCCVQYLGSSVKELLLIALLLVAVVFVYSSVFTADFQNWDDSSHSFDHPLVVKKDVAFADIFLKENSVAQTYIPLTLGSYIIEKNIFGLSSCSAHCINLCFHLMVVLLIFLFGRLLGLSFIAAYIASSVFALHPMHVESVAWVTGRKDVLYSLFYLLALISYVRFLETRRGYFYITALLMAVLSVLSKSMALSLPLVLLLIDHFKGRRLDLRLLLEKVPFFLVVALVAGVTFLLNARPSTVVFPDAFLLWAWSAFFYVKTFVMPIGLLPFYDLSLPVSILNPDYLIALGGCMALFITVFAGRRYPWLIFAILFYVASTFFLWRSTYHFTTIVADRFMYLPSVGFCFLIGYYLDLRIQRSDVFGRKGVIFLGFLLLTTLAVLSFIQVSYWQNSWKLWGKVIAVKRDHYYAHYTRANTLLEERFYKGVSSDFEKYVIEHSTLRFAKKDRQDLVREKLRYFRALYCLRWYHRDLAKGIWRKETFQDISKEYVYLSCGSAFSLIGDHQKALGYYLKAFNRGKVTSAELTSLAKCYCRLGWYDESIKYYTKVIELYPADYEALLARGAVFALKGMTDQALEDAQQLLKLNFMLPGAYDLLFNIFVTTGDLIAAQQVMAREMVLFPHDPQIAEHQRILRQTQGNKVL